MSGTLQQYGLLPTGFNRMRLPEIRAAILASLEAGLGVPVEAGPKSVIGQIVDTFADQLSVAWEMTEQLHLARYVQSAEGMALDYAVAFTGVKRFLKSRAEVFIYLYGTEGVTVPSGAVVRNRVEQENFLAFYSKLITAASCSDFVLKASTITATTIYTVTVNGVPKSFTSDATPSGLEIAAGLAAALLSTGYTITTNADEVRIYAPPTVAFSVTLSANLQMVRMASVARFYAENYGDIGVGANAIDQVITQVPGWNSANNPVAGSAGRAEETDTELRERYKLGVYQLGGATLAAIEANVLARAEGVTDVRGYDNKTNANDADGRPPHSIELVVKGGSNTAVAREMFRVVAAGTPYFGNTTVNVIDSHGSPQAVKFSRVENMIIWLDLAMVGNPEASVPSNAVQLAQDAIVAFGNSNYGPGDDVIIQRLLGPIYGALPGLKGVTIKVFATTNTATVPAPGDFTTATTVAISARQEAVFDTSRITGLLT